MPRSDDLSVRWSGRLSIKRRILAVNIFALAILAGSLFYLDSFRGRILSTRLAQVETEVEMIATAVAAVPGSERQALLAALGRKSGTRLRLYGREGKVMDSWDGQPPTYHLRDPEVEPWPKDIARLLDRGFDAIVGGRDLPPFEPGLEDGLAVWPEARTALASGRVATAIRRAPEGTPFLSAAAPVSNDGSSVLLLTVNARDVRTAVRAERLTLGVVLISTIILSVLLSIFLARTIAKPLRRLARAAHRVRLGRAREVDVPLLPSRRDEIGLLARALHDMTHSLRSRIDATEAFAADVTHELKNPLASLRSAVDSLERVDDAALRQQLLDVVRDDVRRLDRLIVDIAETSRLDAELSRARFEPVDLGSMIESLMALWEPRAESGQVALAFARPRKGTAVIMGEESRIARVLDNIVDNALSFAPPGSLIEIAATTVDREVIVTVEDEGPGVPQDKRQAIFNRFYSIRPDNEAFGGHSGLGLAIARAIVDGHGGAIVVEDRHDGRKGARFVIRFPGVTA
ncbi:sensor histidine kinase [Allosphingosinicella flava]|uniref:sensor histidine kinase n=1 Tax=Allosphingosinicella flava TaxID=2771430 RepID=UPI0021F66C9F|nr:sensor histidine kinase [Sphingosinicella flava]